MAKTIRIRPIRSLRPYKGRRIAPSVPADVRTSRKRVPDFIAAQVAGRQIMPEARIVRPCSRKEATVLRKCHVELLFVGDRGAASTGVAPGSYVQLCSSFGKPGVLVAVADHIAADRIAKAFCACRKSGQSATSCAKSFKETR
jgi:hypothetical protein